MRRPWPWRLVLRLLPERFRERHREEIEFTLPALLEGLGRLGRWGVWAAVTLDTGKVALELRWSDRRGRREMGMMEKFWNDIGFAVRALRRRPGFTAIAVLTLGLGIGANTTIFSVVNGVLLRPLPYDDGDRIGILWHTFGQGAQDLPAVHALDVIDYRDRARTFEDFTMAYGREWILGGADDPEVVSVGVVEAGFFEFFGAETVVGRTIVPEEDVPGEPPAIVLSHRLWERRFGADPNIVGQMIDVAGTRMAVVGVIEPEFRLELPAEAFRLRDAQLWVSLRLDPSQMPPRNFTGYTGFGRLNEGATWAMAQADIEAMSARLREEHPEHAASDLEARVVPLLTDVVKQAERTLFLLLGSVGLVLLIACANVANLVISRSQSRGTEFAVRSSLGAGRTGLARLVLAESLVLSALGLGLGLVLTVGGLGALEVLGQGSVPRLTGVSIDGTVLVFAALTTGLSAVIFGLYPALRATRRDPADRLRGAGTGSTSRPGRVPDGLIVFEVAASLVLLVGTGLMIRTFVAIGSVDPGFSLEETLTFRTSLPADFFGEDDDRSVFHAALREEIRSLPGVRSVATINQLPLTGSGALQPYAYDEETASNWESVTADQRFVSPEFFETIGATMIEGTTFTGDRETDRLSIVIDDRLAERAFGEASAVGQRLQINSNDTPEEFRYGNVVGVVRHIRLHDLGRPHLTQIWYPDGGSYRFNMVVKADSDAAALVPAVRSVMARMAPGAPVQNVVTLEELASSSLGALRLSLGLMTAFGFVAIVLAAVGIYGVLSQAVARRTHEIGVRMALGQSPAAARREVLVGGGRLIVLALVAGLAMSVFLSRAAAGLLYGVEPLDPPTYMAVTGVLLVVSLLACWIPARRATRIDPVLALKE